LYNYFKGTFKYLFDPRSTLLAYFNSN